MSFIPSRGFVSTLNSTTSTLLANATFTGTWEEVKDYASISVIGISDVAGTLWADSSPDGINQDRTVQLSDGLNGNFEIHGLTPISKYFRIRLVNGVSNQTYVRIQTIYHNNGRISLPTSRLTQVPTDYTDVLNTRSILTGKTDGGNYWTPISASPEGHLEMDIQSPLTAFGELSSAENTPLCQIDFVHGINTNLATATVTGSGTATAASSLVVLSTTAAINSTAQLTTRRYIKYRPGQGAKSKFTVVFTTGVANSKQYGGMGTPNLSDGFFFGYNGTAFGICHINAGSETWIPQTTWNVDLCNGANGVNNQSGILLDPTKGNVFQIIYQYLGFGAIKFYIENNTNGKFTLVHQIKYANLNTAVNLANPSLSLIWRAANTTNNTNIVVKGASGALFLEGMRKYLGPKYSIDNNKASITTLTNILTLRNCTTFNGVTNRGQVRIRSVSFAADSGNGVSTLQVIRNTTLGGTPSYTALDGSTANGGVTITNGQSISSYDTAGTTITGGTVIYNCTVARNSNITLDVTDLDIFSTPAETLTFAAKGTASSTMSVAVNWSEDI